MKKRPVSLKALVVVLAVSLLAVLGAPTPASAVDNTNTMAPIAGIGSSGVGADRLAADPLTAVNAPEGVGVAKDGVIYIADTANNRILKIDVDGNQTVFAGAAGDTTPVADGGTPANLRLNAPSGIDIDFFGVIYIADTGNNLVWKIKDGAASRFAGTGSAGAAGTSGTVATSQELSGPKDVAVSGAGILFISDTGNHRIRKVTTDGVMTNFAGTGTAGFNADGADATASQLSSPLGIAVDKVDNVFVADSANNRIRKITAAGVITTHAGTGTGGYDAAQNDMAAVDAMINGPEGVAVDKGLNVYISDTGNNRVRKVTAGGIIVNLNNIDGAPANAAGVTGVAGDGALVAPAGVATDKHGSVFIAGKGEHRVLEVHQPDVNPPAVVISSPAATAATPEMTQTSQGKPLKFVYTCSDFYSGIDTCVGTLNGTAVASGTSIPTGSKATHTLKVTGTDGEGNVTVVDLSVKVVDSRVITGPYAGKTGDNAAVSRLYMGIMKRQPETEGHAYWIGELEAGRTTLSNIAAFFITSTEFDSLYGNATQEEFVLLLYTNIMKRPGDTVGIAYWNDVLSKGTMTRLAVTLFFTQGEEFKGHTETS